MTRAKAKTGDLVAIYADESCLGNGRDGENPGGAAGVIEWLHPRSQKVSRYDYWISEAATTNNRMALRSVIEAFREISRRGNTYRVLFTSDSKYIVDGMSDWMPRWKERGWKRKTGNVENLSNSHTTSSLAPFAFRSQPPYGIFASTNESSARRGINRGHASASLFSSSNQSQ